MNKMFAMVLAVLMISATIAGEDSRVFDLDYLMSARGTTNQNKTSEVLVLFPDSLKDVDRNRLGACQFSFRSGIKKILLKNFDDEVTKSFESCFVKNSASTSDFPEVLDFLTVPDGHTVTIKIRDKRFFLMGFWVKSSNATFALRFKEHFLKYLEFINEFIFKFNSEGIRNINEEEENVVVSGGEFREVDLLLFLHIQNYREQSNVQIFHLRPCLDKTLQDAYEKFSLG